MENYFRVRQKNRQKHNQHFKLLFFRLNTLFGTSNKISTFRKLNLLIINRTCLVVSPLDMQRRLTQANYKFFYSVRIETTHKPSKVAAAKNYLSSVHVV